MLLTLYFFLMVALPLVLGAVLGYNGLPRGRSCPACADGTIRLRCVRASMASRLLSGDELHRRWCPRCDWSGYARVARPAPTPIVAPPRPAARSTSPARRGPTEGVDIRAIHVDGEPWRVIVQCWADEDRWRGRLLFIDPAGHWWPEPRSRLDGESPLSVLTQVLALPETAIVGRIRKAVR